MGHDMGSNAEPIAIRAPLPPQRYAREIDAITSLRKLSQCKSLTNGSSNDKFRTGGYDKRHLAFLGGPAFLSAAGTASLLAWNSPTKLGVRLKLRLGEMYLADLPAYEYPAPMESARAGRQN